MTAKTDKDCAQTLLAAAIVAPDDTNARHTVIQQQLTDTEMVRGAAYIASGQPITGPEATR